MKKKLVFLLIFIINLILIENIFAGISIIGGLTRKKSVIPGEKVDGIILLQNTKETPYQVKIYLRDYIFFADGKTIYGNPGTIQRSNTSWITFSPSLITIPPNNTASVYYTINVPKENDLIGTYWSILMVEQIPDEIPQKNTDKTDNNENKINLGITTIMRYGIQIINEIGDTPVCSIRFIDKKLINKDDKKILQLDFENNGEKWLNPSVYVELYDNKGLNIGKFESDKARIFPGCSIRHNIDLTNVPKGKYKASVIIDNEDENVFGAQYDLQIE